MPLLSDKGRKSVVKASMSSSSDPIPTKSSDAASKNVRSVAIAAELESEIVKGTIPAGARLDEQTLTKRFNVSRTPIREALHILVARSLAERVPYRGVIVVDITPDRIEEMFEAMGEIEALCGQFAAERMGIGERGKLEALHTEMGELARSGDPSDYAALNTRFHGMIYAGTQNRDIADLAEQLRLKLAPFRRSQLQSRERVLQSNAEHQTIVEAILERDTQAASKALRKHLIIAAQEVLAGIAG